MRTILHVDMDAFFAAIEQRDNPEWQGLPVIVGGRAEDRGVVATASYEARLFGVHSAMPMVEAKRRCPGGIYVPSNIRKYQQESRRIMAIFLSYTPEVEALSIDEAFLDVSHSRLLYGDGVAIARAIQKEIADTTRLSASIGVAPNKFLAKLASDLDKPRGLSVIRAEDVPRIVWPLPISRMLGVGAQSEKRLLRLGIRTIGDLAAQNPERLEKVLGKNAVEMVDRAKGLDDRPVVVEREAKSIGRETTFPRDISDHYELETALMALTEDVCRRLRSAGVKGHTVTLKWRLGDFSTFTRATQLPHYASDFDTIWQATAQLFRQYHQGAALRLIGITVSQLLPAEAIFDQPLLFDGGGEHRADLDELVDAINAKMGRHTLGRARILPLEDEGHDH